MADLNALIAQGAQFAAPVDPFAQYGKMQQLQQADSANQLNRMKMEEMQAANTERNALRQLDPTSPDYESQLFKVNPTMGIAYRKEAAAAAAQQATQKTQQAEALKTNLANHRSFLVGVNDQPSYDAWRALTIKNIPDLASILPAQFSSDTKDGLLKTADDISKRLTAAPVAPPASVAEFERAQKDPKFMQFLQQRAAAGRAPATPSAPVAVVDPVSGKPIFVSREQAISGGMSPASAQESLPPKEIQKREAALPAATSAMKGFESKSDSFIADLKALRDHPGLSSITGLVYGRTPSATREGRAAQALYDKVVAKGGFQALQDLRDASKTGGALGNVSNTEGAQLKSSFAAIDRTQDAPDVQAAIDQAISSIEGSKTRMREAYDSTYSYKSGGAPAAAAPAAGGSNVVVTPDGQSHTFPTPAAAAQFKKAAGI